jgi:hypothetical protein
MRGASVDPVPMAVASDTPDGRLLPGADAPEQDGRRRRGAFTARRISRRRFSQQRQRGGGSGTAGGVAKV